MSDEKLLSPEKPFTADLESLKFALASANIGTWDVRLVPTMIAVWDDRCREIFGVGESLEMNFVNSLEFIHPDDREMVAQVVKDTLAGAGGGDSRFRRVADDPLTLRQLLRRADKEGRRSRRSTSA